MPRTSGTAIAKLSPSMSARERLQNIIHGDQAKNPATKLIAALLLWPGMKKTGPLGKVRRNIKENFFNDCLAAVERNDVRFFTRMAQALDRRRLGYADPVTMELFNIMAERGSHNFRNSDVMQKLGEKNLEVSADTITRRCKAIGWRLNSRRGAPQLPQ